MYAEKTIDFQPALTLTPETYRVYFNQIEQDPGRYSIDFATFKSRKARSTTESQILNNKEALPLLPKALSPPPYTQSNESWIRTACSMSALVQVHLCVDSSSIYRPILGIILYYSDGRRESVGQIRLDWMIKPITIVAQEILYFSGKRCKKSWGYVAQVTTELPSDSAQSQWLEVNQGGTLEWWFSSRQSVLFYNSMRLN